MQTIKCKKCGSTLTYIKFKSMERVCRQCGYIEKLTDRKDKDDKTKT